MATIKTEKTTSKRGKAKASEVTAQDKRTNGSTFIELGKILETYKLAELWECASLIIESNGDIHLLLGRLRK